MPYFLAGKPLAKGQSFSAGDTLFPSNFLDLSTAEERSSLGIKEESDSPSTDLSEIKFGGGDFQENDSLRSKEESESPSTIPSETRLAGGNFETSVPTVTESPKQESNAIIDNEFPDLDATTKSYIEALGQDFFKENIAPRLAGSRFEADKEGVTYRKPSNLKGGVLSYNRQDKIQPPTPEPDSSDSGSQTPALPLTFTPPPGSPPKIEYPTDTKPAIAAAPLVREPEKVPEIMAMSRYQNAQYGFLDTGNPADVSLATSMGYTSQGPTYNLFKDQNIAKNTTDVFRVVNPATGNHFLTASRAEADAAAAGGFINEGVAGEAYSSPQEGSAAVQRYYNATTGQHLLTSNAAEAFGLANQGYNYEGIAFYAPQ